MRRLITYDLLELNSIVFFYLFQLYVHRPVMIYSDFSPQENWRGQDFCSTKEFPAIIVNYGKLHYTDNSTVSGSRRNLSNNKLYCFYRREV